MSQLKWWRTACAVCVLCAATAIALPAQTFTTLLSFDSTDGAGPVGGLVQAANGDLYGTTLNGGAQGLYGTVFKITPGGVPTTLYIFCSQDDLCPDGSRPAAGLVQGLNGNLYGTTSDGGANGGGKPGDGTVFQITPSGALTTLLSFDGTDGQNPVAALIQATDGNFYGTTFGGGANGGCFDNGCGTIFRITPGGKLTTLDSPGSGGNEPMAALVQATDGNFYGTMYQAGATGAGTVFKITPTGTLTTLHSFYGDGDGDRPIAALVQATDGDFYGTTSSGGANGPYGTVFKITPSGRLTTLYSFGNTDGADPEAALLQGTDGNFYGTTLVGGANSYGTVFEITPSGSLTTLYSFCSQSNCADGGNPQAGLIQDTNGTIYGTTNEGGTNGGYGTVFSLSVGLGPFVKTLPTSGKVGSAVKILGNNLKGATSVTFNGTTATFSVASKSLITTTVPAGATSGTVQVVTPGGTLSSNVPFRVVQ